MYQTKHINGLIFMISIMSIKVCVARNALQSQQANKSLVKNDSTDCKNIKARILTKALDLRIHNYKH